VRFVGGNNRDNIIENNYVRHVGEGIYVRNNIIEFDGPDLLSPFTVVAGSRRANVAVDEPPIWNHQYTCENNVVWSSSGSIFRLSGKPDEETFKRADNNVYYNPDGRYSFGRIRGWGTLKNWQSAGLESGTKCVDPLFVDRENHDYRLKPDSPALALGFQQIDTSEIGLKKDFHSKMVGDFYHERSSEVLGHEHTLGCAVFSRHGFIRRSRACADG